MVNQSVGVGLYLHKKLNKFIKLGNELLGSPSRKGCEMEKVKELHAALKDEIDEKHKAQDRIVEIRREYEHGIKILNGKARFDIERVGSYLDAHIGQLHKYKITAKTGMTTNSRRDGSEEAIFFGISTMRISSVLSAAIEYLQDVGWMEKQESITKHMLVEE